MIVFIILVLSVYLGGDVYVFYKGMHALSFLPTPVSIITGILFWLCAAGIFGMFIFRSTPLPSWGGQVLQYIGTGWLVFIFYMAFFLFLSDLCKWIGWPIPHAFGVVTAITFLLLLYGFIHYKSPLKEDVNIAINKYSTLDKPLKVVGISDIHLGYATNKQQLKKYVEKIMDENPDLILIAGDLIDNSVAPVRYQRMQEELSRLSAPLGIYMIPGNHEYISGIDDSIDFLKETPICLLKDSVVTLPNKIQLIGRDDRMNPDRLPLDVLVKRIDPQYPVLLLDHQPYNLEEAVENGIDLQFSGHTHRGQVWPINWITDRLFEVSYGYKKKENMHVYVSSGLSLWGPPFRIGTHSEMVVFHITTTQ
ncbi:MAG: metallophosphoesterase [Tannerellaceae bacterium]|nr:metallophosphoesterase [Tannerellaceae bacterium]